MQEKIHQRKVVPKYSSAGDGRVKMLVSLHIMDLNSVKVDKSRK